MIDSSKIRPGDTVEVRVLEIQTGKNAPVKIDDGHPSDYRGEWIYLSAIVAHHPAKRQPLEWREVMALEDGSPVFARAGLGDKTWQITMVSGRSWLADDDGQSVNGFSPPVIGPWPLPEQAPEPAPPPAIDWDKPIAVIDKGGEQYPAVTPGTDSDGHQFVCWINGDGHSASVYCDPTTGAVSHGASVRAINPEPAP